MALSQTRMKLYRINCNWCGSLEPSTASLIHQGRVFCSRCALELIDAVSVYFFFFSSVWLVFAFCERSGVKASRLFSQPRVIEREVLPCGTEASPLRKCADCWESFQSRTMFASVPFDWWKCGPCVK